LLNLINQENFNQLDVTETIFNRLSSQYLVENFKLSNKSTLAAQDNDLYERFVHLYRKKLIKI
jgi:hypothetical protein